MTTAINPSRCLNLRATLLLLACAAAWPVAAQTAAGQAQYAQGVVMVSRAGTPDAVLAKGSAIQAGDTITTGEKSHVQLRFSDGGFIALHANSRFSINGYVDAKDADKDQFFVALAGGGMRAITGLIGKLKPSNYKVTTPTAVIGIRGSGFNIVHNANGTMSVTTELDAIEVCNKGGCLGLNVGESALVRNAQDKPVRTNIPATLAAPSVTRQSFEVGNEAEKTGQSSLVAHAAASAAQVFGINGLQPNNTGFLRQYFDGTVRLDTNGQPIGYTAAGNTGSGENTGSVSHVQRVGSAANNDELVVGTWSAGVWRDGPAGTSAVNNGLAPVSFFTGQGTSNADLAGLSGKTAVYAFDQATPVQSSMGNTGALLPSSRLTANFSGANTTVGVSLDVRFPATTGSATPNTDYALRGTASSAGTGFAGNLSVSGAACATGCGAGAVSGAFIGPNASRAGVSFAASTSQHGNFVGAAGFSQK